ncbi:unnamed protein product [Cyprideis torosa]|uniref:Uncharacterized protein n=1 Tax=Cyprideis torosa TaxID=163714 RepID=A0A7R8ZPN8_9CRUS|nr:unnamed protein product [Cyprideis torosa]CAG0890271.1 unnamed protein product [Cyprideis torosa]
MGLRNRHSDEVKNPSPSKSYRKISGASSSDDNEASNRQEKGVQERSTLISESRVFSRVVIVLTILTIAFLMKKEDHERTSGEITWVSHNAISEDASQWVKCADDYSAEDRKTYEGCISERCGRLVTDQLVTEEEVDVLLSLAQKVMAKAGGSGGATIMDLHSGALSSGDKFVDLYQFQEIKELISEGDLQTYVTVRQKVQSRVASHFGVSPDLLHLTHPTFFSRLTSTKPVTPHDEYWHLHVDKETYDSFFYTSLVYLTDTGKDFGGGRFIFVDPDGQNRTVEPRRGRVSMFSSGSENKHLVEPVEWGTRFALTIAFTCDAKQGISDPTYRV